MGWWKGLMDRDRGYEQAKEQLDWLEAQIEADPFAEGFWDDEPEDLFDDFSEDDREE